MHVDLAYCRKDEGVVAFVSNHVPNECEAPLVCPKPSSPNQQRSTPYGEFTEQQACHPSKASSFEKGEENIEPWITGHDVMLGNSDVGSHRNESPDVELRGILDSLDDILDCNMDESEGSNFQYIGVTEDARRVDYITTFPKFKRVLSYNALFSKKRENCYSGDAGKRMKWDYPSLAQTTLFSTFSLGSPQQNFLPNYREDSPIISIEADAALDSRLCSELEECRRDESPVPLLTQPESPLTVEMNGTHATVCEWPSNLTFDSAILAADALDPAALETRDKERGWYKKGQLVREPPKFMHSFCV